MKFVMATGKKTNVLMKKRTKLHKEAINAQVSISKVCTNSSNVPRRLIRTRLIIIHKRKTYFTD